MSVRAFFLIAAVVFSGCAQSKPPAPTLISNPVAFMDSLMEKTKKQKIVVICMQADLATNQKLEDYMVNHLNQHGFQAVGTRNAFPAQKTYTALQLLDHLHATDVKGTIEVVYSGRITSEGVPEQYALQYRPLKVKKKNIVNTEYRNLMGALLQLLIAMPITKV